MFGLLGYDSDDAKVRVPGYGVDVKALRAVLAGTSPSKDGVSLTA